MGTLELTALFKAYTVEKYLNDRDTRAFHQTVCTYEEIVEQFIELSGDLPVRKIGRNGSFDYPAHSFHLKLAFYVLCSMSEPLNPFDSSEQALSSLRNHKWRALRAAVAQPATPNWQAQGDQGEVYAREWMNAREIEFVDVDQSQGGLSDVLKEGNAKRCDFFAQLPDLENVIVLFDAKHHDTAEGTQFRIDDEQLAKYLNLEQIVAQHCSSDTVLMVFIVVSKESAGKSIYIVGLNEIEREGVPCRVGGKTGKLISLNSKLAEW